MEKSNVTFLYCKRLISLGKCSLMLWKACTKILALLFHDICQSEQNQSYQTLPSISKQSLLNVEIWNSSEISCLNQHNSRMQSKLLLCIIKHQTMEIYEETVANSLLILSLKSHPSSECTGRFTPTEKFHGNHWLGGWLVSNTYEMRGFPAPAGNQINIPWSSSLNYTDFTVIPQNE